jgi:hypothetical protein
MASGWGDATALAGGAGEAAGQGEQTTPEGLGDHQVYAVEPDGSDPAQQVVGEGGDDRPSGVGQEAARGAVAQPGTVFEVADGQLADSVAAMVGVARPPPE